MMDSFDEGAKSNLHSEWPIDDPNSLLWWLEEGGAEKVGHDLNEWLGMIFVASDELWRASTPTERRAWRDVALTAIEWARRMEGLTRWLRIKKEIYVRMSYLRNSQDDENVEDEWRKGEMRQVFQIFLEWVPGGLTSAPETKLQLVQAIGSLPSGERGDPEELLEMIQYGANYLDGVQQEMLQEWMRREAVG